jgi:hypothetical protein
MDSLLEKGIVFEFAGIRCGKATHGQDTAPEIASVCVEYGFPPNTSSHTSFTCLKSDQDDPKRVPLQTP